MKRTIVLAVLTAILASASCTVHRGTRESTKKDKGSTTSTTVPLFGLDENGNPTTGTTAAGSSSGTSSTAKGGSTSTTAPVDRHGGPGPGTYQYDTVLTQGTKSEHGNSGYQVVDDRAVGNGWRQLTTWVEGSSVDRMLVSWKTNGRTVEFEQEARGKSVGPMCDWTPDYLELAAPLSVGMKWSATSKCDQGHTLTKDRTFNAEVTGTEKVIVDGRTLDTFVIRRKVSTTQHVGDHLVRKDEDYTDKFAPSVGLLIQMTGTQTDYLDNVPKGLLTRTRKLLSLKPSE